jgi:hypothetical protein
MLMLEPAEPNLHPHSGLSATEARDPGRWTSSLLIGLAFAAVALLYSLVLDQMIRGGHFWFYPADVWSIVDAGRDVWHGALGYVYQGAANGSYALPLSFVLIAPASGLIDHFGLVEGAPFPVAHPSAWLVVGPYTLMFGIVVMHAARRLAWELGVRHRLWVVQVLTAVVVLFPTYYWGHFEDAIALAFVMYAVRRMLRQEYVMAALLLSVAVSAKQWVIPLIPLIVFSAPPGRRLRCLVAACALSAAFATLVFGADWADASKALLFPVNQTNITEGHVAFYWTWFGSKTSRASRTIGLLLASGLACRLRRVQRPAALMGGMAALLLLRPLFEAINFSYYWTPALILAGFSGLAAHRRVRWQDWIWPVLAILWSSPRSNLHTTSLWWIGELIVLSAAAVQVAANCGASARLPVPIFVSFKKPEPEPILTNMTTARPTGGTSWTQ